MNHEQMALLVLPGFVIGMVWTLKQVKDLLARPTRKR
jgi:hypothetical protein